MARRKIKKKINGDLYKGQLTVSAEELVIEFIKSIKWNLLAQQIAFLEGKKHEINIADIKEVLKCAKDALLIDDGA